MSDAVSPRLAQILAEAWVAPEVISLRPDYRAVVMVAERLQGGPSDAASEALLVAAEAAARARLGDRPAEEEPHVAEWREAFKAFGAKPSRTRNSLEALLRRVPDGLPRINRLADIYNAISIGHGLPLGGEDLDRYQGVVRLVRATGDEPFDTVANGEAVVESPDPGEVVWRDDLGVTCRRWNWRQCARTQLTDATTSAIFILDSLGATGETGLAAAAEALAADLGQTSPGARIAWRVLGASDGASA